MTENETEETTLARCSACGKEVPRNEMFGAEPDLLCEACSQGVRERMAPSPTGRMVSAFVQGTTPVTFGILGIAVVLYLLGKDRVYPLLSMLKPADVPGYYYRAVISEPWRLLTSAFLHAGFFHILFNAWWIWELGRATEARRGSVGFALLVVGSATVGGALTWLFSGHGVGLSGVVYALAGFLFATRKHDPVAGAVMNPSTTRFLAAWLVIGVILAETGTFPIGNWAHGGGAVFGYLAGLGLEGPRWRRWVVWPALGAVTVALVLVVHAGTLWR